MYASLQSASNSSGLVTVTGSGTQPTGVRSLGNENALMAEFRVHRNFYP
jgi:hypothetical protein